MAIPKCIVPLSKTMDDLKKDQKSMSKSLLSNPSGVKSFLDQKLEEAGGLEGIMAKAKTEGKKNLITKVERTQKVGSVVLLPDEYYDVVKVECSSIGSNFFWEERNYKIEGFDDGDAYVDVGKDRRVIKVTYRIEDKNPPKNYQEELLNLKKAGGIPGLFNKLADEIEKTFKEVDDKVADIVAKIRKDEGNVPKNPEAEFSNEEFQKQFEKDLAAFQAQGGALGPLQKSLQSGHLSQLGPLGQAIGTTATNLIGGNGLGNSNSTVTQLTGTSLTSGLTASGAAQDVGSLDFNSLLQKALTEQPTTRTVTKTTPVVKNYDSIDLPEEGAKVVKVEIVQKGGSWFSSTNDYIYDDINQNVALTKVELPLKMKVTYTFEEAIPEAAKAADTLPDAPLDICAHVDPIEVKEVIQKSKDEFGKEFDEVTVFKQTKSKPVITTVSAPPKQSSVQEETSISRGEDTKVSESNPSAVVPVVVVEETTTDPVIVVKETNTVTKSRKVLEEEWVKAKKEIGDVFAKSLDDVVINTKVLETFPDINPKTLANTSAFNSLWDAKVLGDSRWKQIQAVCQNLNISIIDVKAINDKALPSLSNELREFYNDANELEIEKFRMDELKDLIFKLSWSYCTGIADRGIFGPSPETHSVPVYKFTPNYPKDNRDIIQVDKIMNANYEVKPFSSLSGGERMHWVRTDGQTNFYALNSTEGDNAWFDEFTVTTLAGAKIRKFDARNADTFFKDTLPKTLATIKKNYKTVQPLGAGGPGTTGYSWFKRDDFMPQV